MPPFFGAGPAGVGAAELVLSATGEPDVPGVAPPLPEDAAVAVVPPLLDALVEAGVSSLPVELFDVQAASRPRLLTPISRSIERRFI